MNKTLLGIAAFAATTVAAGEVRAQDCSPPRILFVVDASASMNETLMNETKWESAQLAIQAVLDAHGNAAEFGLMTFPGAAGQCTTGDVVVDVAAGTGSTIMSELTSLTIPANAQTPAGQTLNAAANYAGITDSTRDNYVIFVTDGYQYCSVDNGSACVTQADCTAMGVASCPTCLPDANDGCFCVQDWTVLGAQALAAQGVDTYVVGFGSSVNFRALNETAFEGGTGLPGCDPTSDMASCYFQASVPSELTSALSSIVQEVVTETCTGDCGIEGERTCTLDGWSDCEIPSMVSCQSTCATPGFQECANGMLTECSSEVDCNQGGGGAAPTTGSGAGGAGGAPTTGSGAGGVPLSPGPPIEDDGSCGCRTVGTGPSRSWHGLWILAGALAFARRRRES